MTRLSSVWSNIVRQAHQWQFRRACIQAGAPLHVHGRCLVSGSGSIRVGNHIMLKSPKHQPIDIYASSGAEVSIGDHTFINRGVRISCSERIQIGSHCLIGDDCVIIDNDYHAIGGGPAKVAPIDIGDHVWLALRVIVLRGVTIGTGSVVGAGSIVTRSIPPYTFAAGAPARAIRTIEPDSKH